VQDETNTADLVLEGGGVKGIGLLGAVLTLAEAGYRFPRVAGTSAGAIVATLVAAYQKAGRDLTDLVDVMRTVEYERFAERPLLSRLTGPIGTGFDVAFRGGGHTGDYLDEWLRPLLADVGVHTFADLRIDDPDSSLQPYQRYSLVVHASDLSRRVLVRLPWDYSQYGLAADDQSVVGAVRASMAIPFYFRPVRVRTTRGTVTWVDGGLLSNFPITVFDRTDSRPHRWPTWGVKLSGPPQEKRDVAVDGGAALAIGCLQTLIGDRDRYRLDEEGVNRRTMYVNTAGVSATDFSISENTQRMLFENGQLTAHEFLKQQQRAA
jgi:NTE family protein